MAPPSPEAERVLALIDQTFEAQLDSRASLSGSRRGKVDLSSIICKSSSGGPFDFGKGSKQ